MGDRTLSLRVCWEDWYVLDGGGNWASIEGYGIEWLAVANALRGGDDAHFKRLSCIRRENGWDMHSPRNAMGSGDHVLVGKGQAAALADEIASVVGEAMAASIVGDAS